MPVFDAVDEGVGEGSVIGPVEEVDGGAGVGDFGGEFGVVFNEEIEAEFFGGGAFSAGGFGGEDFFDLDFVTAEPGGGGGEPAFGAAGDDVEGSAGGPMPEGFEEAFERGLGVDLIFVLIEHGGELFFGEVPMLGEVIVGAVGGSEGCVMDFIEEIDEGLAGLHEGVVEIEGDF